METIGSATGLIDKQRAIRDVVHGFVAEGIHPAAHEADETRVFPGGMWDGLAGLDLTGLTVPEEYGGFSANRVTYAVVNEEAAYDQLATAAVFSMHCLTTECITESATDQRKETWLPGVIRGRSVGMFGLSKPSAGPNPAEMSTVARCKDNEYVINDKKQWVTSDQRSDVCTLFAKTGPDGPSSVTQFLVPESAGYEVGKKEEKLGLRASDATVLLFDNVRIPAKNRLTEEGKGLSVAFRILIGGRIGITSRTVRLAQAALDDAIDYVNERKQFDKSISKIQAACRKITDMGTQVHALRMLVRETARVTDTGGGPRTTTSIAKYFASEAAVDMTNEAVQVRGGYGYATDFDVKQYYRNSKITTIYGGTSEIQKEIIARSLPD